MVSKEFLQGIQAKYELDWNVILAVIATLDVTCCEMEEGLIEWVFEKIYG